METRKQRAPYQRNRQIHCACLFSLYFNVRHAVIEYCRNIIGREFVSTEDHQQAGLPTPAIANDRYFLPDCGRHHTCSSKFVK